jgi:hypothetical protein
MYTSTLRKKTVAKYTHSVEMKSVQLLQKEENLLLPVVGTLLCKVSHAAIAS